MCTVKYITEKLSTWLLYGPPSKGHVTDCCWPFIRPSVCPFLALVDFHLRLTVMELTNKINMNDVNEAGPTSGSVSRFGRRSKASQVVSSRKLCPRKDFLKIGTWNVRSMLKSGKLANIIKEMVICDSIRDVSMSWRLQKWKSEMILTHTSELELSLQYVERNTTKRKETSKTGDLHVVIKQAFNLLPVKTSGVVNAFCKM